MKIDRMPFAIILCFIWSFSLVANDKRPNVLFIAIDDLNDMVGFLKNHPGVRTPNMNALAKKGVNFGNAHCAAPACNPSRIAVLSGLSPSQTGVYLNRSDWREKSLTKEAITLPDAFRAAGYTTKGGGKVYHAHTLSKEALGGFMDAEPWDEYFPSKKQQLPNEIEPEKWPVNCGKYYRGRFDWSPLKVSDNDMADGKVVSWAEQQLARKHDKPLFLAVGIYRPHIPWWTPNKYYELHPMRELRLPETKTNDLSDIPENGQDLARKQWQQWMVENDQWEKAVQGYLASMSFADAMVGRLIDALEKGPLADNSIIVLWSDHGYHLGHKQHWEKFALWEQTTHVPLLFVDTRQANQVDKNRSTRWANGQRCNQPVSLLDIFPTLIELCDLEKPKKLDGNSLVPLLREPQRDTERAVVTTHNYMNHSVRSLHWRYIRYAGGGEELYDHRIDPHEFNNLAKDEKHSSVKKELARWLPRINRRPE